MEKSQVVDLFNTEMQPLTPEEYVDRRAAVIDRILKLPEDKGNSVLVTKDGDQYTRRKVSTDIINEDISTKALRLVIQTGHILNDQDEPDVAGCKSVIATWEAEGLDSQIIEDLPEVMPDDRSAGLFYNLGSVGLSRKLVAMEQSVAEAEAMQITAEA